VVDANGLLVCSDRRYVRTQPRTYLHFKRSSVILVGSERPPSYLESANPPLTIKDMMTTPSSRAHSGSHVFLSRGMKRDESQEILESSEMVVLCVVKETVLFPGTSKYVEVMRDQAESVLLQALGLRKAFQ
jgi:hypothetical protein